ncbi:MAG: alpha/beta hydrolase [Bacteroidota bacterium]
MKNILLVILLGMSATFHTNAQQLTLKKGVIIDAVQVNDSIAENFSLYLPKHFKNEGKWPVLFVFDMQGRGKQVLRIFQEVAEQQGYILAASNNLRDSISIPKNILISDRMISKIFSLFPIHRSRMYTAGFAGGARFASIIPTFIKEIDGVIACGAGFPNIEILNAKKPFHFIGIVGKEDYNYPEMLQIEKALNKRKFKNQLLIFDGEHEWPPKKYLNSAVEIFTLSSMAKGHVAKDSMYINHSYEKHLNEVKRFKNSAKLLAADDVLGDMLSVYNVHKNLDSLKESRRALKKEKLYRSRKRNENNALFKESLLKEDYVYYLEEDVLTYNFNNLGWWSYQMDELEKFTKSINIAERQMGKRLKGFVNALIADDIDVINTQKPLDETALNFLWMLKTITAPTEYPNYLSIISSNAKNEDFGTALFYLEELLKNGYTNGAELYALEHTALLKITPEYNAIVAKYLKDARYDIIEE